MELALHKINTPQNRQRNGIKQVNVFKTCFT